MKNDTWTLPSTWYTKHCEGKDFANYLSLRAWTSKTVGLNDWKDWKLKIQGHVVQSELKCGGWERCEASMRRGRQRRPWSSRRRYRCFESAATRALHKQQVGEWAKRLPINEQLRERNTTSNVPLEPHKIAIDFSIFFNFKQKAF